MRAPYIKSGKVGNLVYSRNRFSPICYERVIPANPRTEKQVKVRSYLAIVSAYWRLLSDWERLLWGIAGAKQRTRRRLGRSAPLTGFNYFMRLNLRRLNRGGTLVERPPEEAARKAAPGVEAVPGGPERQCKRGAGAALAWRYGILSVLPRCWLGGETGSGRQLRVRNAQN